MVIITVQQLINGEWMHVGDLHMNTATLAMNYIDGLQERMISGDMIFTFRPNVKSLLVINMAHGPVKFSITE
jgi:hypothetical protein